jgi:hypothetical protein
MPAADIWKNAPSTIRHISPPIHPQNTPVQDNQQNIARSTYQDNTPSSHLSNSLQKTPLRQGHTNFSSSSFEPINSTRNNTLHHAQRTPPVSDARHIDDHTIKTLQSTTSTTLNSSLHASKFAELELAIKTNQQEFKNLNRQHVTMEGQLLETMTSCHENTKQMVIMQGQMNALQITMQTIAAQLTLLTQNLKPHDLSSPAKKKHRQTDSFQARLEMTLDKLTRHLPTQKRYQFSNIRSRSGHSSIHPA